LDRNTPTTLPCRAMAKLSCRMSNPNLRSLQSNQRIAMQRVLVRILIRLHPPVSGWCPGQSEAGGGSVASVIQTLWRRGRSGISQSQGCSTAWRIRPNHQCARFNCRARDRGGELHGRFSKPSCNCPLGMRNLVSKGRRREQAI
jgi:hypothetical protein